MSISTREIGGFVPIDDPSAGGAEQDPFVTAQTLSDDDQTLSDGDQTGADLDQTASDADRGTSERDQRASDRDQRAADLDQAASDRVQELGAESDDYAHTRRTRSQTMLERDRGSQIRSEVARVRETTAERRDRDADARDSAAAARDQFAAAFDADIEQLEASRTADGNGGLLGLEVLLRAARDRKHAAASRARAAMQRQDAARDRELARGDRLQAGQDRRVAAEALAAEGIDHLTGAMRRRVGLAAIQREIDRTRRTHDLLVLGFVDVDGLKAVNDARGHGAGDQLLSGVAQCIKVALRPYDVILRYGGDEFVCSLSGQDLAGVGHRFEQISAQIAKTQDGATISVGFAEGRPQDSLEETIMRADQAMMEARRVGR